MNQPSSLTLSSHNAQPLYHLCGLTLDPLQPHPHLFCTAGIKIEPSIPVVASQNLEVYWPQDNKHKAQEHCSRCAHWVSYLHLIFQVLCLCRLKITRIIGYSQRATWEEEGESVKAILISVFKFLLLTKGRSSRPVYPAWYANDFKLKRAWPQELPLQTIIHPITTTASDKVRKAKNQILCTSMQKHCGRGRFPFFPFEGWQDAGP